jgi:hypothetical protein
MCCCLMNWVVRSFQHMLALKFMVLKIPQFKKLPIELDVNWKSKFREVSIWESPATFDSPGVALWIPISTPNRPPAPALKRQATLDLQCQPWSNGAQQWANRQRLAKRCVFVSKQWRGNRTKLSLNAETCSFSMGYKSHKNSHFNWT